MSRQSPSVDLRQFAVLVEWRRRGQRPLQRRCSRTPRTVTGETLARERFNENRDEDQDTETGDERPDRRNVVPTREGIRIVRITARHAGEPQEVLREERGVHANERDPE